MSTKYEPTNSDDIEIIEHSSNTDTGLLLIEESGLLLDNKEALNMLKTDIEQTHRTVQMFRTRTEMEVSVLTDIKHPTPDAKYWQSVREQDVHYTNLVMLSFNYKKKKVEKAKLERKLVEEADDLERELIEIELEEANFVLGLQEREGYHRLREICEWADIKSQLAPNCEYSLEDVNDHQLQSMIKRFTKQEAVTSNMQTGPADMINIKGLAESARKHVRLSREKQLEENKDKQLNGGL